MEDRAGGQRAEVQHAVEVFHPVRGLLLADNLHCTVDIGVGSRKIPQHSGWKSISVVQNE